MAGWVAGLAALLYGCWQHRLASDYATGLLDRTLGPPLAGVTRPPVSDWGPGALTLWMAAWTVADVLLVVAMSAVAARRLGTRIAARPVTVDRGHVTVALAVAGLLVAALATLSGLIAGGAASAQAAVSFVTANAVPMLATGMLALVDRGGLHPEDHHQGLVG
jgi:hypothetical protein